MARNAAAVARQLIKHRKIVSSSACGYGYRLVRHQSRIETRLLSFRTTESPLSKASHFSSLQHQSRFLSSESSAIDPPPEIALINSAEQLKSAFQNVQDGSLQAVFYFSAIWCGPCKYITLTIEEIRPKYPHVKFYKIDIDQKGLGDQLEELNIAAVPTMHFFDNGKFVEEMVGADRNRFKKTMEKHYKVDLETDEKSENHGRGF